MAALMLDFQDRFERMKLQSIDELPDLSPSPETLFWDFDQDEKGKGWMVIRNGAEEIWRELSAFEKYHRFAEVGPRDLVPTARSELDLYGDKLGAPHCVELAREGLRKTDELASSKVSPKASEEPALSESAIVQAVAEDAARRVTRKVISTLQKMTVLLSGDDSELMTSWDEICVQVQGEVRPRADGHASDFSRPEKKIQLSSSSRGQQKGL
jgi:hypothetical protein